MRGFYEYFKIVELKIPDGTDVERLADRIIGRYDYLRGMITSEFGERGFYVLCIFFLMLAIIIVIHIRSVLISFGSKDDIEDDFEEDEEFEEAAYLGADGNQYDKDRTNETENTISYLDEDQELSRALLAASMADTNCHTENKNISVKRRMKRHADAENKYIKKLQLQLAPSEHSADMEPARRSEEHAQTMIAMILNMLGRRVSDRKIAQAMYVHYGTIADEEDIIQTVRSVRDFIGICNAGKFDFLPKRNLMPSNADALYNWANGDPSGCLLLLQALLNQQIKQAENEDGIIRDMTYAMAANCSCIMGNIARIYDADLAHNSFELATELSPKNVIAWSRLGDVYMAESAPQKAMIAYQNVLDIGDEIMYGAQLAHVHKQMSEYYQNHGIFPQLEQYRDNCRAFYEAYGILVPLTEKENKAYEMIANNSSQYLRAAINGLLRN